MFPCYRFFHAKMAKRPYSGRLYSRGKRAKYGKRRGRRTRRFRRRRRTGGFARRVKRIMYNADEKHRYTNIQTLSVSSTGLYTSLFEATGGGEERESFFPGGLTAQRDGYKIQPVSCSLNLWFTVADSTNLIRVMITRYICPPPGGSVNAGDFLENFGTFVSVHAPYNRLNVPSRVRILYDKQILLNQVSRPFVRWKWYCKRFPQITYDASTAASWRGNMYQLWIFSDSNAAPHVGVVQKLISMFVNI
jgi:hypothetical protein